MTEGRNGTDTPKASRLNWLTTSRHISRYYKLREIIETGTYKLICAEHEEYWRHRFYVLLDKKELRNKQYYMDESKKSWPENIEMKSAMVINDFSNWPDPVADPLDDIDQEALKINGKPFHGYCGRGIESYYCVFEEKRDLMEKEYEASKSKT